MTFPTNTYYCEQFQSESFKDDVPMNKDANGNDKTYMSVVKSNGHHWAKMLTEMKIELKKQNSAER